MILKDNTKYISNPDSIDEFLALQNITNRKLSELMTENEDSLLIYPQSFYECEDDSGKQSLVSLQTHWDGNKCTKAILETGNIAGFIGSNEMSLSIHSRFAENADEDFFLHYMLQKVMCINIVNLLHNTSNEPLFDFLLYLFPKFLNEALAQGLYKEYQRNEYNDANVRGSIEFKRHLELNIPFHGRIAYRTREFSYDNHVTQLIRHTIEYISRTGLGKFLLERDDETRANIAQIISATRRYNNRERDKVIKSNLRVVNHPYYSRYAPLQKLCVRILKHARLKYGLQDDKIYGVLFDISYLWEEYLGTILVSAGFEHPKNKDKTGRKYLAKGGKLPRYPDFYRSCDGSIIDAKYKSEIDKRDDINQIITYMYRLKGKRGIFVQPTVMPRQLQTYELLGYGEDNQGKIDLYSYPIPQRINSYKNFITGIMKSESELRRLI